MFHMSLEARSMRAPKKRLGLDGISLAEETDDAGRHGIIVA
jgi:hypothetical protein